MSRITRLASCVLLDAALTTGGSISAAGWRGWVTRNRDYPVSKEMDHFRELVAERTGGCTQPKTRHHSVQFGKHDVTIEQMQFGAIGFAVVALTPLNNLAAATQATTLPYAFRSNDHMHRDVVGAEVGAGTADVNIAALMWYDNGSRSLESARQGRRYMQVEKETHRRRKS